MIDFSMLVVRVSELYADAYKLFSELPGPGKTGFPLSVWPESYGNIEDRNPGPESIHMGRNLNSLWCFQEN